MNKIQKMGILVLSILVVCALNGALAAASDFSSWRTGTGVVVQKAGNDYLQPGRLARIMEPAMLKTLITDADPTNDPLILDVRFGTDFNGPSGRIPGAIWIADFNKMAEPENLDALDAALADHILRTGNDDIVVYCHLGQMSGLVTGVLGSIGYDVKTLKLGYNMGWLMIGSGGMGGM
jgi:rhodanese-related sulfurtransferase